MDHGKFEELVDVFCNVSAGEFFTDVTKSYDYSDESLRATVTVVDFYTNTWDIPLTVDGNDDLVIDIGDAGFLTGDSAGLFAYLFNEAIHRCQLRVAEANQKIMDLKADMTAACLLIPQGNGGK